MPHQIYQIAEICVQKGVSHAVISPGSRCAPLSLAFIRHPKITTRTITDERSAAFIGLGIAQETTKPVVLICTSGSAAYNYAPAITEAFYQQVPLIVLTADRPPEWIDQQDGQTIHQQNIYAKHVKKSYQSPVDLSHKDAMWHLHRIMSEAINQSEAPPKGPVHINIPLREPLYPGKHDNLVFDHSVKIIEAFAPEYHISDERWKILLNDWSKFQNILILSGQANKNEYLIEALSSFISSCNTVVAGDIVSNLHTLEGVIRHADIFLASLDDHIKKLLRPDLLITFGKSIVSKNIKLFLRKYKPSAHWHIQEAGVSADSFQSLTRVISASPTYFFSTLNRKIKKEKKQTPFQKKWLALEDSSKKLINSFFNNKSFSEFEAVKLVIDYLPSSCNLHIANSMSVRYTNLVGLDCDKHKDIKIFSNRGTSGIDGCVSTAVGVALESNKLNVLLTGDLAFFYDRNAFWNNYNLKNLRIIVLNNHGGGIFRLIDGPRQLPELETYFETKQALSASNLAEEFNFDYVKYNDRKHLSHYLPDFFSTDKKKVKILEIETDRFINQEIYNEFKYQNNRHLKA